MKRIQALSLVFLSAVFSNATTLTQTNPGYTGPESTRLEARGLQQYGNFKAHLRDSSGQTTLNPGNSHFWTTERAWQLDYTHATSTFRMRVFETSDLSSATKIDISRLTSPSAGKVWAGVKVYVRGNLGGQTWGPATVTVKDVRFNSVAQPDLSASVTVANGAFGDFTTPMHYFQGGLGDWSMTGVSSITYNTAFQFNSDRVSWEVKNVEAVPEPASLAAMAVGVGAILRRRRK